MKKRSFLGKLTALVVTVVAATIFSGCGGSDGNDIIVDYWDIVPEVPFDPKDVELKKFTSCVEMDEEFKAFLTRQLESKLGDVSQTCRQSESYTGPASPTAPTSVEESEGGASYTKTNVQEPDIDEDDLIKTDGEFVYAVVQDEVRIVRAWPFEEFGQASSIPISGTINGLFLAENRLIVISNVIDNTKKEIHVQIFDVTDKTKPTSIKDLTLSGELVGTRMKGADLFLAINNVITLPNFSYTIPSSTLPECDEEGKSSPTTAMVEALNGLREKNLEAINSYSTVNSFKRVTPDEQATCTNIYRNMSSYGSQLLSVIKIGAFGEGDLSRTSILGNGGTMYMSRSNIVVATPFNPFGKPYSAKTEDKTILHRFSITGTEPEYAVSNYVDGHLLDNDYHGSHNSSRFSMAQFAMSEFNDHFRVASTTGTVNGGGSSATESFVTVFDLADNGLTTEGKVGGLGKGERIYAVRFAGELGYIVTYKYIDPLYVVDLSDPAAPVIAGELKVPGFSTYLHPIDGNKLIGLGFDTNDLGTQASLKSLKLSLFDVSDKANPKEAGTLPVKGNYSAAIEEHHAFTYDANRRILSLPVSSGYYSNSGAKVMLFKLDDAGNFATLGEANFKSSPSSGYVAFSVLRTIIIGDGKTDGIISLTESSIHLHSIAEKAVEIGQVK